MTFCGSRVLNVLPLILPSDNLVQSLSLQGPQLPLTRARILNFRSSDCLYACHNRAFVLLQFLQFNYSFCFSSFFSTYTLLSSAEFILAKQYSLYASSSASSFFSCRLCLNFFLSYYSSSLLFSPAHRFKTLPRFPPLPVSIPLPEPPPLHSHSLTSPVCPFQILLFYLSLSLLTDCQ